MKMGSRMKKSVACKSVDTVDRGVLTGKNGAIPEPEASRQQQRAIGIGWEVNGHTSVTKLAELFHLVNSLPRMRYVDKAPSLVQVAEPLGSSRKQ